MEELLRRAVIGEMGYREIAVLLKNEVVEAYNQWEKVFKTIGEKKNSREICITNVE